MTDIVHRYTAGLPFPHAEKDTRIRPVCTVCIPIYDIRQSTLSLPYDAEIRKEGIRKIMNQTELFSEISKFQDSEGRLTLFPAKRRNKTISLYYLSTKFEPDIIYSEKQVNDIIEANHTFQDKWLLRRELINLGLLCRLTDGSQYWLSKELPQLEDLLG